MPVKIRQFILQIMITVLFLDIGLSSEFLSLTLYDSTKKEYMISEASDRCLVPASLQKIIITVASLNILGEGFSFITDVCIEGEIKDGVYKGKIFIKGSGDPLVSSLSFSPLIDHLKEKKTKLFKGEIIIDRSIFDEEFYPLSWEGRDGHSSVYSRVSGFNINRNLYSISITEDQSMNIYPVPEEIDKAYIDQVIGQMRKSNNKPDLLSIRASDMETFSRQAIIGILKDNGIEYAENPDIPDFRDKFCFSVISDNLTTILQDMNTESNNLIAEAVLKYLAFHSFNEQGSLKKGISVLNTFFAEQSHTGFVFADGSGFSRSNRLSSGFIVDILAANDISKLLLQDNDRLSEMLGINVPEGMEVYYKTGSIWGVRSLAGYINYKGRGFVFAIIINARQDIHFFDIGKAFERISDKIVSRVL